MIRHLTKQKPSVLIIGLYIIVVLIRFLLALLTSAYPMINIDEFLYYGMARSLASGNGLMFRGQPANYSYILYSLTLAPVYLLGLEGPVLFRVLQLWNILLVSTSVFPLHALATAVIGDERKAFLITAVSMLLPDFMLGQMMMGENLIIPLFYTLIYCMYLYLQKNDVRQALIIGLLGGLIFSVKPGSVIPAAVFLLMLLVLGLIKHQPKLVLHPLAGAAVMLVVAAVFFGIVHLLGGKNSILSIYDSQVADSRHLDVFFRFIGIYILYLIIAGGVGCFALTADKVSGYTGSQKTLFWTVMISLGITVLGVSWTVNRYEYNATTAHMRYIGMYIPITYMFAMINNEGKTKNAPQKAKFSPHIIILAVTALLLLVGIYAGVNQYSVFAENMTLSVIIQLFRHSVSPWVATAAVLALIVLFAWLLQKKQPDTIAKAVTLSLSAAMLINNCTAYSISRHDTRFDFASEAAQLHEKLSDKNDVLYLYTTETTTSYYGALDSYSSRDICFVYMNDMFNHLYASQGTYIPFLPDSQRGNVASQETPDTDTIIMDATVYCMLEPSENTEHFALNENGLHLVRILDKTKPWLKWIVGNTKNTTLHSKDKGILLVFDQHYLQSPLTVTMTIRCEQDDTLSFYSGVEQKSLSLQKGQHQYTVTFEQPQNAYNFEAEKGDIRFFQFELANQ